MTPKQMKASDSMDDVKSDDSSESAEITQKSMVYKFVPAKTVPDSPKSLLEGKEPIKKFSPLLRQVFNFKLSHKKAL
jgi:hypothetical protein